MGITCVTDLMLVWDLRGFYALAARWPMGSYSESNSHHPSSPFPKRHSNTRGLHLVHTSASPLFTICDPHNSNIHRFVLLVREQFMIHNQLAMYDI